MQNKGYKVLFSRIGCMIIKGKNGRVVLEGIRTSGNVYYIK